MALLGNIRVGNKLLVILFLNALLLLAIGGLALMSADSINENLKSLYGRDFKGMVFLLEADRDLHQALIAERSMIFAQPGTEEFATQMQDYAENKEQADTRVDKFAATSSDPDQAALVKQYHEGRKAWDEVSLSIVDHSGKGVNAQGNAERSLGEAKTRFDAMRENLNQLTEMLYAQAEQAEGSAEESFSLLIIVLASLTVFSLLLGVFFTLLVTRNITAPLARILDFTGRLSQGDFPPALDLQRKDELGQLAESFDTMNVTLQSNMKEIAAKSKEAEDKAQAAQTAMREAEEARLQAENARREGMLQAAHELESIVGQIGSASEELNAQIRESQEGSEVQRNRASEGAAAMEEMNVAVLEVARNASNAAENADRAREQAENGGKVVNDVVGSIEQLNRETANLSQEMVELGHEAESIGQVMAVINDIADQTNLLALNAAIEAARAGDSGRGFAVVADEVRKLAEKTMSATQEVGNAINAIQNRTRTSIGSMEQTAGVVNTSTELANQAGQSLNEIIALIESTADQVRAIATASEEQSATSEEINRGSEEINRIATETAEAMSQSAMAMDEIAKLSGQLVTIIDRLKSD